MTAMTMDHFAQLIGYGVITIVLFLLFVAAAAGIVWVLYRVVLTPVRALWELVWNRIVWGDWSRD